MIVLISLLPCSLVLCQQFQWICCCQALWCRRGGLFLNFFPDSLDPPSPISITSTLSVTTTSHPPPGTSIQPATTTSRPPSSSSRFATYSSHPPSSSPRPATSPSHPPSSSPRPATSRKRKNRLATAKDAKRRKECHQKLRGNIREGIIIIVFNCWNERCILCSSLSLSLSQNT